MLKVVIFRFSFQLLLCCCLFNPQYFFLSLIGMFIYYAIRKLSTRIRYCLGSLLLCLSFISSTNFPITYGFILCNTYSSVQKLILSDLKYEMCGVVYVLELAGYLFRTSFGYQGCYLFPLVFVDILNSLFMFEIPSERKEIKDVIQSVKYLLEDYVLRSLEYKAIFREYPHTNLCTDEHSVNSSDFSEQNCNLTNIKEGTCVKGGVSSTVLFDFFTPLILINIDNIFYFYAISLVLLPVYKMEVVVVFILFFYILHLETFSLFLVPFCKTNFCGGFIYFRLLSLVLCFYYIKVIK